MQLRGQHVVLGMIAVCLAAAAFAWWYQRSLTDRALALYGGETAAALREPERVEYLKIAIPTEEIPAESSGPAGLVSIAGQPCEILAQHDITTAPGAMHARQALLENASYADLATAGNGPPQWSVVLIVTRGTTRATIAFDFVNRRVRYEEAGRELALGDRLLKGLPVFFGDIERANARGARF